MAVEWIVRAWQEVTPTCIQHCFRHCNVISDDAVVLAEMEAFLLEEDLYPLVEEAGIPAADAVFDEGFVVICEDFEVQEAAVPAEHSEENEQAEEGEGDEEEHEPPISLAQMARHWMEVHNRLILIYLPPEVKAAICTVEAAVMEAVGNHSRQPSITNYFEPAASKSIL